jgi:hypothetical protein
LGSTTDIEADPLLGTFVGSYRLVRVLGQGGMGRVYAAVHPEVGARVAIKVIAEQYARDAELTERFFAEARAVNLIRHECIVSVFDLARMSDGRPVIVMELVEGRTLREVLQAGPTALGGVVHAMLDVLSALAAAHAVGIVHRDLKPDNIVVTASGRAKVLDFGIAKLLPSSGGPRTPRTRTGVILGTPEYMAPEQINGGLADPRSDVYAMGVVLFEAVTGQRPFRGRTDFELMKAHVDEPPPLPRALRPDLPAAIEAVILCALAKHPSERFASATVMANALHAASEALAPREWRALTPTAAQIARPLTPPPPPEIAITDVHALVPFDTEREVRGLDAPATAPATPGAREEPAMNRETAPVVRDVASATAPTRVESDSARRALQRTADDRAMQDAIERRDRASDLAIGPRDRASDLAIDPRLPRAPAHPAASRSRGRLLVPLLAAAAGAAVVGGVMASRSGLEPPTTTAASPDDAAITSADAGVIAAIDDAGVVAHQGAPAPADASVVTATRMPAATKRTQPVAAPAPPSAAGTSLAATGAGTPANPLIIKRDYDPKQLDPNAYFAKVTAIARQLVPDAELTLIHLGPVLATGKIDLTLPGANTYFMFVSPSKQAEKPVGVPANTPHTRTCFVMVNVTAADIRAYSTATDNCGGYRPMTKLQCTTQDLWKRAIGLGQKADLSAELSIVQTAAGKSWSFSTGGAANSIAIEDDCKIPKPPPAVDPRGIFSVAIDEPFEPLRYAVTAQQLARKLEPDATISEIQVHPVARDGTLDLDLDDDDRSVVYRFQSAARAKDTPAVHKYGANKPVRWCEIYVILGRRQREFVVGRDHMTECNQLGHRLPRCSAKQLWAKVLAKAQTDPGPTAYMYFVPHRKGREWEVATSGDADQNHRIYERDIPDDCK